MLRHGCGYALANRATDTRAIQDRLRSLWQIRLPMQAGATPAPPEDRDASTAGEPRGGSAQVPTADDICRALEQSAAENALPVEFFARASSELASASNPFDLCLHHPLNYAGQVFVQP